MLIVQIIVPLIVFVILVFVFAEKKQPIKEQNSIATKKRVSNNELNNELDSLEEEAQTLLEEGEYRKAAKKYHSILSILEDKGTDEQWVMIGSTSLSELIYLYMNMNEYKNVIDLIEKYKKTCKKVNKIWLEEYIQGYPDFEKQLRDSFKKNKFFKQGDFNANYLDPNEYDNILLEASKRYLLKI